MPSTIPGFPAVDEQRPPQPTRPSRLRMLLRIMLFAILGVVLSFPVSILLLLNAPTIYVWMPHHIPEHKGGLSFRFAMAHDVIHERFAKHGREHYLERNRVSREAIQQLDPDDPARWPLTDDLAAGLDRVGESAEAVRVMQEKLDSQTKAKVSGRDLYTSFANLGTFLIHANFRDAMAGDTAAVEEFAKGVEFIRKSVQVNPDAHFGRERWQAAIAEFILAAVESPELFQTYDCIGNQLDRPYEACTNPGESRSYESGRTYGAGVMHVFHSNLVDIQDRMPEYFQRGFAPEDPKNWEQLKSLREFITQVGAEGNWSDVNVPSHQEAVPFDEPMLGIIGMWRQGGGANPHFSLAIAETMLRVGQRHIAWTAYARAKQQAERYSPDPDLQKFLIEHCSQRQTDIENDLNTDGEIMQIKFEDELAFGLEYQESYQSFEASELAAGVPINAPGFFDQFYADGTTIASPSAQEETYPHALRSSSYAANVILSNATLAAGLFSLLPLLPSWLRTLRSRRRNSTTDMVDA